MKKLFLFILGVSLAFTSIASGGEEYRILKDLKDTWRFYSEKDNALLPYIPENNVNTRTLYFYTEPGKYPGESLIIAFQDGASLWINDQLVRYYEKADTVHFSMDSLTSLYSPGILNMVLYHPSRSLTGVFTVVGSKIDAGFAALVINPIVPRSINTSRNYFIIIGILIVVFYTVLLNLYPKDSRIFFSLGTALFSNTSSDELFKPKTITKAQFLYLLALSSIIAFLILVYHNNVGIAAMDNWLRESSLFFSWSVLTLAFFILSILKYLLILIMCNLFDISDKVNYYFFEITIFSTVFYSGLFITISIVGLAFSYYTPAVLAFMFYLVITFYLLRTAIMFLKIRSKTTVKNLHLFSYLCTTELLPVIIGMKYFMN